MDSAGGDVFFRVWNGKHLRIKIWNEMRACIHRILPHLFGRFYEYKLWICGNGSEFNVWNTASWSYLSLVLGVPLYACGGGTIPLLRQWLEDGMSMGSAAAFMITGSATKITNLGAVKIVLGIKRFILYLLFTAIFALISGLIVNLFVWFLLFNPKGSLWRANIDLTSWNIHVIMYTVTI